MPKSGASSLRIFVAAFVVLGMTGFGVWGAVSNAAPSKAAQKFGVKTVAGVSIKTVPEVTPAELLMQSGKKPLYAFDYTNTTQNPISLNSFAFSGRQVSSGVATSVVSSSTLCGVQGFALASGPEESDSLISDTWVATTNPKGEKYVFTGTNVVLGPQQTKRVWLRGDFNPDALGETSGCTFVVETSPMQTAAVDSVTGQSAKVVTSGKVPSVKVYWVVPRFSVLQDPQLSPTLSQTPGVSSTVAAYLITSESGFPPIPRHVVIKSLGLKVDTTIKPQKMHEPYVISVATRTSQAKFPQPGYQLKTIAQKTYVPGVNDLGSQKDDIVFSDSELPDIVVGGNTPGVELYISLDTIAAVPNDVLRVEIDPSQVQWGNAFSSVGKIITGVPLWSVQGSVPTIHF